MKKLLAALALALLAAQMGVEATGGDKSKAPTYSKYSLSAQTYLPVKVDSTHTFYRIPIRTEERLNVFDPTPADSTFLTIFTMSRLLDAFAPGQIEVGQGTSETLVADGGTVAGAPSSLLQRTVIEMGIDTIVMEGGAEGNRGSLVVRDSRIAIVGGTGRFRSATGEGNFELDADSKQFLVLKIWVPRLREYN